MGHVIIITLEPQIHSYYFLCKYMYVKILHSSFIPQNIFNSINIYISFLLIGPHTRSAQARSRQKQYLPYQDGVQAGDRQCLSYDAHFKTRSVCCHFYCTSHRWVVSLKGSERAMFSSPLVHRKSSSMSLVWRLLSYTGQAFFSLTCMVRHHIYICIFKVLLSLIVLNTTSQQDFNFSEVVTPLLTILY